MSEDLNTNENAAKTDLLQEKLGLVPDNPGVYLFKIKTAKSSMSARPRASGVESFRTSSPETKTLRKPGFLWPTSQT